MALEFIIGVSLALVVIAWQFLYGAPYLPSHREVINDVVALAEKYNRTTIADLGSGDGRVVRALAKKGINTIGYELNPFLVWLSRLRIGRIGARIERANYWKVDISKFDAIFFFGMPHLMERLDKKCMDELQEGAYIFSNGFSLPSFPLTEKRGTIYVYKKV